MLRWLFGPGFGGAPVARRCAEISWLTLGLGSKKVWVWVDILNYLAAKAFVLDLNHKTTVYANMGKTFPNNNHVAPAKVATLSTWTLNYP